MDDFDRAAGSVALDCSALLLQRDSLALLGSRDANVCEAPLHAPLRLTAGNRLGPMVRESLRSVKIGRLLQPQPTFDSQDDSHVTREDVLSARVFRRSETRVEVRDQGARPAMNGTGRFRV